MEINKQTIEGSWAIIAEKHALRPVGFKILIKEDEFKSRYDCSACGGKGHTDEVCALCNGTKYEKTYDNLAGEEVMRPCRSCTIRGERTISYGFKLCPTCNGKQGTLIVPEDSKKRPTTGIIIAIGNKVTEWKIGQHVIYNNYTGTEFVMEQVVLRIMMEDDVLTEYKALNKTNAGQIEKVDLQSELKDVGA